MSSDGSEATVLETLIGIGDAVNTSSGKYSYSTIISPGYVLNMFHRWSSRCVISDRLGYADHYGR